jgi:hypothetical protein
MKKNQTILKIIFSISILFNFFSIITIIKASDNENINITNHEIGTVPISTWGINLGWNTKNNTLNDGIPKSKVTLARIDASMGSIFNNFTSPNFNSLDLRINATKTTGIEPLLIIAYMPNWLAKNQSNITGHSPPKNMSQWVEIIRVLVNHVKNDVKYYEIWNEPDGGYFWEGNEIDYRNLLINTSKVIKENYPDAKILAPSSCNFHNFLRYYTNGETWQKSWIYMNEICKNASNAFDIISFHDYEFPLDAWSDGLNLYEQKINELGCNNKLFWFTEGGLYNNYKNDYSDVLQVAKWRKILLDAGMEAQIYYPFTDDKGQLYDTVSKTFSPVGKYYQLMGTLQFWGSRLDIINNTPDDISTISSIAVKNTNDETLVQLTNNLNESKEVQLSFPSYSNITIYESSADQIFDYPTDINETINLSLTLKPYSVYILRVIENHEPTVFTSTTTPITTSTTFITASPINTTSTFMITTNVPSITTTTTIIISTNQTTIPTTIQTTQKTTTVINQNSNENLGITNNLKTLAIFASFTLTIIIIGIFPISRYLEKKQLEQINYEEKQHPKEEVFEEQPKPIIREIIEKIPEQTEEPVKVPEEKQEPTKIEEIEEKIQPVKQPEKTEEEIIEERMKSLSEKIARLKSKMHEAMKEVESEENN